MGTPLAAVDASYFEVFPLDELEGTLALLRNSLAVSAFAMSLSAAALGRYAAGRVLGPLAPITTAAARIADGNLQTRLPEGGDRDLAPLTDGFNSMAASLQERIEREARFASDVSHELRSPLAAIRAAIDVIGRRRATLPAGVDSAFDILAARAQSFEQLVLDLLEISRFDANGVVLNHEELEIEMFLQQVLALTNASQVEVVLGSDAPPTMVADKRRLAQAFSNIITNADRYAGGLTSVTVLADGAHVSFLLDDDGPGIDPSERTAIFQRFARGTEGRHAGSASGTGLGLALALAHVELHGGDLTVESSPGGGSRFIIRLPQGSST